MNANATIPNAGVGVSPSSHPPIPSPSISPSSPVGLSNLGATCYLNSLLQSLYATPEVRRRIHQLARQYQYTQRQKLEQAQQQQQQEKTNTSENDNNPSTEKTSSTTMPIASSSTSTSTSVSSFPPWYTLPLRRSVLFQLHLLFSRLALSRSRSSVSTVDLIQSFGWSSEESFRQNDIQELMRVLFTALESSIGRNVSELYTGELHDIIECVHCHHRRMRSDTFMDISLSVIDQRDLLSSLTDFTKTELMDGSNALICQSSVCNGTKQSCRKRLEFGSLPKILTFQLKRFIFDFELMQRKKVDSRFDFPVKLDMKPFQTKTDGENSAIDDSSSSLYELFGILVHSGVAMGGHYFAYLRTTVGDAASSEWFEFNDTRVTRLAGGVDEAIRLARGGDGEEEEENRGEKGKGNGISSLAHRTRTSAYMLMYTRVDPNAHNSAPVVDDGNISSDDISSEVRDLISREDEQYALAAALAEKQRRLLQLQIHYANMPVLKLEYDLGTTMGELLTAIREHYQLGERHSIDDMRLRRFDPTLNWPNQIYSNQVDLTLEQAKLSKQNQLILEMKQPEEEWTIEDTDMIPLRCVFVTPSNVASLVDNSLHPLLDDDVFTLFISLERQLDDLRSAISAAATSATHRTIPSIPSQQHQRILLLHENRAEQLSSCEVPLKTFDFYPGRWIYVEHALEPEYLRPTFEAIKCTIDLCYNIPSESTGSTGKPIQPEYNQRLRVSRRSTIGEVKAQLSKLLELDMDHFRLSRNHTGGQLKDETMRLDELQLVDQSAIYVSMGRPLKKEEVQVQCFLYQPEGEEHIRIAETNEKLQANAVEEDGQKELTPESASTSSLSTSTSHAPSLRFQFLFSLPIPSNILIRDLKSLLLGFLSKKRPPPTGIVGSNGFGIIHLRIRDKKGSHSHHVYEDERTLSENVASTAIGARCEDGLELAIQPLNEPELWTKDKFFIQIQEWRPKEQRLGPIKELVTKKNLSVGGIKKQIYQLLYPNEKIIETPTTQPASAVQSDTNVSTTEDSKASIHNESTSSDASSSTSSSPPRIYLAKGKSTSRMKKSDCAKLSWFPPIKPTSTSTSSGSDQTEANDGTSPFDSKLFRNALNVRQGELIIVRIGEEEPKPDAPKRKSSVDSSLQPASTAPSHQSETGQDKSLKPWQRSKLKSSTTTRPRLSGTATAIRTKRVVEQPITIKQWEGEGEGDEETNDKQ